MIETAFSSLFPSALKVLCAKSPDLTLSLSLEFFFATTLPESSLSWDTQIRKFGTLGVQFGLPRECKFGTRRTHIHRGISREHI